MKAIFKNCVIAESNATIRLENNEYFPRESVRSQHLQKSETTYHCTWKGECEYYNVAIGDEVLQDGAWSYLKPAPAAENIAGHIAFARGIDISS